MLSPSPELILSWICNRIKIVSHSFCLGCKIVIKRQIVVLTGVCESRLELCEEQDTNNIDLACLFSSSVSL